MRAWNKKRKPRGHTKVKYTDGGFCYGMMPLTNSNLKESFTSQILNDRHYIYDKYSKKFITTE